MAVREDKPRIMRDLRETEDRQTEQAQMWNVPESRQGQQETKEFVIGRTEFVYFATDGELVKICISYTKDRQSSS